MVPTFPRSGELTMNRRSFLGAIAAAIVAPQLARAAEHVATINGQQYILAGEPIIHEWWTQYMLFGEETLLPGEPINEVLLDSPSPRKFEMDRLVIIPDTHTLVKNAAPVINQLEFRLSEAGKPIVAAPVSCLGTGRLFVPFIFQSQQMRLDIASARGLEIEGPVTIRWQMEGRVGVL